MDQLIGHLEEFFGDLGLSAAALPTAAAVGGALIAAAVLLGLWRMFARMRAIETSVAGAGETFNQKLDGQRREWESAMESKLAAQTAQIAVMADSWRATLGDGMTRIVKEIGGQQREEARARTEQHQKTIDDLAEQHGEIIGGIRENAGYLHDRLTNQGVETEGRFRVLGDKLLTQSLEHSRRERELIADHLRESTAQMTESIRALTGAVDAKMSDISEKVGRRLEASFAQTNQTFQNVLDRLAKVTQAQQKIEALTADVVNLNHLLDDKRARGAFGEIQLKSLVEGALPAEHCSFQHTLSNARKVDCLLKLPPPTGDVPVDSKFPLENYQRIYSDALSRPEQEAARRQFSQDVKRHIRDIAGKYILPGETANFAVMYVPAEAVFAEIHARHRDAVEEGMRQRVYIASPTTLMAMLNIARAILRDLAMHREAERIRGDLIFLHDEFRRFDERMRKLANHIAQAHNDTREIHITSRKISERFQDIEAVGTRKISAQEQTGGLYAESPRAGGASPLGDLSPPGGASPLGGGQSPDSE